MSIDQETLEMLTGDNVSTRPEDMAATFEIIGLTEDRRYLVCSNGFTIAAGLHEKFCQDIVINDKEYHLPILRKISGEWQEMKE